MIAPELITEYRHTLTSGRQIVGLKQVLPVILPTLRDSTAAADTFRRRNAHLTTTNYFFGGIRTAQSLEGLGRWSDPVPVALQDLPDPYDARAFKRVAWQSSGPGEDSRTGWRPGDGFRRQTMDWRDWGVIESEDCCVIHIDTPAPLPGANLPVRVYFHGGGNTALWSGMPRGRGDRLPVVSVHVEYPLSTWGFFSHPDFDPAHQANLAYQVSLRALEWIQDHIHEFGGDPTRVMISGGSAGGAMASLLMAQGGTLFQRSLAHSGSGAGRRATMATVHARARRFWASLIKSIPAYYDRSRTIQQVAEDDGIATALRLGPSPAQIEAFGNRGPRYDFTTDPVTVTDQTSDDNLWPILDGTLIEEATAIGEVMADRWPTSVAYMATYTTNEAGLIDNARDFEDGTEFLEILGIIDPADQATAIEMLTRPGDRWSRVAYNMLYSYGAERSCREHSANGGSAYLVEFGFDSPGNGRDRPSHVNQEAYFLRKPQWQVAMGATADTLLVYESDIRCAEFAGQSMLNFAANGDPNDRFESPYAVPLYDGDAFGDFETWQEFGDRKINVMRNSLTDASGAEMAVLQNVEKEFYDFVDARFNPF